MCPVLPMLKINLQAEKILYLMAVFLAAKTSLLKIEDFSP
jgi:hypothetical protein